MSSSRPTRAEFLVRIPVLLLGAALGVVAAPRLLVAGGRVDGFPHPPPREGVTGERVLPVERLPDRAAVREAYALARAHPALFDGLYCACRCEKSHGHRSLLSCYESEQAIGCLGCREEAAIVGRVVAKGGGLAETRAAIDAKWG